jgi:hypothetical protein
MEIEASLDIGHVDVGMDDDHDCALSAVPLMAWI